MKFLLLVICLSAVVVQPAKQGVTLSEAQVQAVSRRIVAQLESLHNNPPLVSEDERVKLVAETIRVRSVRPGE